MSPGEMTKFYNELVDSEFTHNCKNPAIFAKEKRFKHAQDETPGPGYYNPVKSK